MELVRIFKEHNVFGWISVGTAILSLLMLNLAIISNVTFYSFQMLPFAMAAVPFGIIELFIKRPYGSRFPRCRTEYLCHCLCLCHRINRCRSSIRF